MFQNRLFIILAVVFALTSIGLGIALVFTLDFSKTEETKTVKTEYNFTGKSVKGAEVSFREIGPNSSISCGTEFTIKAPENWYFEASLPVSVINQDEKVVYVTHSQLLGEQTDGISKFTLECEFPPQEFAYLRISKDNPSDLPENSDYIQIAVGIINPQYDPNVPDENSDIPDNSEETPENLTIKVFFKNTKTDPNVEFCEAVSSVEREIPYTKAVATAAINELIAGPTSSEKTLGFTTQIASDLKLKSLSIKNGVAYADFSTELDEAIGGSCAVSMIRAQITETLKQFSTVNSVVISRNGQVEDILQP